MMQIDREFWFFVTPPVVGFAALGLVGLFFAFPEHLYPVGSAAHVGTAAVAIVALAGVACQTMTGETPLFGGVDGE